jgi:type IV secretory pathway TrbD component
MSTSTGTIIEVDGVRKTFSDTTALAGVDRGTLVVLVGLAAGLAVGFRFHTGFLPSLAGVGLLIVFGSLAVMEYRRA